MTHRRQQGQTGCAATGQSGSPWAAPVYACARLDSVNISPFRPARCRQSEPAGCRAGLVRGDLRDVRGSDVIARSGGLVVAVRGARPRTVPVLARYHQPLLAAARFAGAGLICGGADPGRRNLTSPLITALDGGTGLPRLDTSRLRASWLAEAAELLGLATFMAAAGISCSQRLGDLVAGLVPGSEADAVRLLGGTGRR